MLSPVMTVRPLELLVFSFAPDRPKGYLNFRCGIAAHEPSPYPLPLNGRSDYNEVFNWLREFFGLTITIDMHRGVIRLPLGEGRGLR